MIVRPLLPSDWPAVAAIFAEGIATGDATFETSVPTWEHWEWGGKVWRENMRTDVSTGITGVELQGDDPEALAKRWGEILGFSPTKTGGGWKIDLPDGGEIRFVVAADGRGEGLGRFDVAVNDPDAVRAAAEARGKLGEGGDVILSGTRVRLVQA